MGARWEIYLDGLGAGVFSFFFFFIYSRIAALQISNLSSSVADFNYHHVRYAVYSSSVQLLVCLAYFMNRFNFKYLILSQGKLGIMRNWRATKTHWTCRVYSSN